MAKFVNPYAMDGEIAKKILNKEQILGDTSKFLDIPKEENEQAIEDERNSFDGSIAWIVYLGNKNTQSNFPMSGRILPQHLQVIADEANYFFQIATIDEYIQARVYKGSYIFKSAFWRKGDTLIVLADDPKIAADFVAYHLKEPDFVSENFYKRTDETPDSIVSTYLNFMESEQNPEKSSLKRDNIGNIVVINFDSVIKNLKRFFTEDALVVTGFIIAHGIGHNATDGGHANSGILIDAKEIVYFIKEIYEKVLTENTNYPKIKKYIQGTKYLKRRNVHLNNSIFGYDINEAITSPNYKSLSGLYLLALPYFNNQKVNDDIDGGVYKGIGDIDYINFVKKRYGKKN